MNNPIESFYNWYREALRHPKYRWLIILGTAAYLLSPLDISPDVFPIIGWIDDSILATLLVAELSSLLMDNVRGKGGRAADSTVDNAVNGTANSTAKTDEGPVIDVEAR
ncbi:MAG: DUF1232 domain-containing protein [Phormidesmis sp. RL_2_1]|nr:DUF1232 domain-containing protein [Phormidesmis sp. RL_2_1]